MIIITILFVYLFIGLIEYDRLNVFGDAKIEAANINPLLLANVSQVCVFLLMILVENVRLETIRLARFNLIVSVLPLPLHGVVGHELVFLL